MLFAEPARPLGLMHDDVAPPVGVCDRRGDAGDRQPVAQLIVHQTEGPAGSAKSMALAQAKNPQKRGVTIWVETDGTVYWSTAETAIPTHGDGANRNDGKFIDNAKTYHAVVKTNSIGVEFNGNYPDVTRPAMPQQARAG